MNTNDPSKKTEPAKNPTENSKNNKWTDFIQRWKKEKVTDRFMIYLTGIIALCSLIVAGFTYLQMSIYIDATHIENRAYIVLACQIDPPRLGERFHVRWEIKNVGKTPAYRLKEPLAAGFESTIGDFWKAAIDRQVPDTGTVIGSDVTIADEKFTDSTMTAEDMVSYRNGTDRLIFYLNVVYDDVFHVPHYTHLAVCLDPKTDKTISMRTHNDAN